MSPISPSLASAATSSAPERISLETLLEELKGEDADVRTRAWRRAGEIGAPAVRPLAGLMNHPDAEVARAAKRGIWQIVRHSGRPGAEEERAAVESEILQVVPIEKATSVLREMIWMLSELGTDSSAQPIAALLSREDVREDARMGLERIPGDRSLAALKAALETAPEDFKQNMVHSLRVRGVEIAGYPSAKLVPSRKTEVQPVK
jgi:HEAT repeat protein